MKLEWVKTHSEPEVWNLQVDGVVKASVQDVSYTDRDPRRSYWRFSVSPANVDVEFLGHAQVRGESPTFEDAKRAAEVILKNLHPTFLLPLEPRQTTLLGLER